ncbi:saccharopine dehydrogenase NADP-binding domain-containing protein [Actinoplanes sp. NEAU-A12]|uniref:Saccharopine dehydrogenase NADP-binding domain-containing protein n=1 Tax=Actinoplanes sandaracinus TaxID=3045177 RepID=A0ABT6WG08_9ACTN|nr:saccharopine dehydrogenase NADP-binding domain-containing protein [Actinoplanes sandaracinus]MDI6098667.1 saccharopine dehydrogenase NADP-binding domain-containing protein [Actinoplanes sandaracinus]
MSDRQREFDVIVYGASGFVGVLTARHLAASAPAGTRLALGGRSAAKLEQVKSRLGVDWPIVVADADDASALATMAGRTRVVLTTVGPYAKYGRPLARVCAETGTDYVDLTGEVLFARDSIDENHETARRTGARIVHSCGFDSIPSDIGVHVLHALVSADGEGELTDTTLVVTSLRGGFSGGTIDSMRHQVDVMKNDVRLRKIGASPYSLSPDRAAEPELGRQPDMPTLAGSDVDPSLRGHLAPFVMASYNTRVVRRSNALRGWAYGRKFRYREVMSVGTSPAAPVIALATKAALNALVIGFAVPPVRFLLDRILPAPGTGPSETAQRNGHFTMDIFTKTTSGARYRARVKAKGDPGYAATAVMLGESALALALDRDRLPESEGGVLTPATAIGDVLTDRLRTAGFEITAQRL